LGVEIWAKLTTFYATAEKVFDLPECLCGQIGDHLGQFGVASGGFDEGRHAAFPLPRVRRLDPAGEEVLKVVAHRACVGNWSGASEFGYDCDEQVVSAGPVPIEGGLGDAGGFHYSLDAES
jgi:hypothetical protein